MKQFNLPTQQSGAGQVKAPGGKGGVDLSSLKIQTAQMYSARLEMLGNQLSRVKINVGQQTVSQTLPQIPKGLMVNQNLQITITSGKQGQAVISFYPEQSSVQATPAQTIKLSLSDAQLVSLLSLNKNYQANAKGQIQTRAEVVSQPGKDTAIKLPGLTTPVKIPAGVATLVANHSKVDVTVQAKGRDIQLEIKVPGTAGAKATTVTVPLAAEKLLPIIKPSLIKLPAGALTVAAKGEKVQLPNQQTLNLTSKVPEQAQLKIAKLSERQMIIQVNSSASEPKLLATSQISRGQMSTVISQAIDKAQTAAQPTDKPVQSNLISQLKDKLLSPLQPKAAMQPDSKVSDKPDSKVSDKVEAKVTDKAEVKVDLKADLKADLKISDKPAPGKAAPLPPVDLTASTAVNSTAVNSTPLDSKLIEQKQQLSRLIDPLIRLMLPKKLNWTDGLKTLAALEQQLPPSQAAKGVVDTQQQDLKQLLNQVKQAIPDHNSPLNEKTVATIMQQLLNFSPAKVAAPSAQPTPANAIANALQLLLGSKVAQSEPKLSPQLLQQLTTLLKPSSDKQQKTAAMIKNITGPLAQTEQSAGSLKTLVGIQSGVRTQQLENVEKRLDGNNQLDLTIPLRVGEQVKELHIKLDKDSETSKDQLRKTTIWQLNLTFDLDKLGKLLVNAKLKEGEISMNMYAEQPKTLKLMEQFSDILEQRLEFHGVKINQINRSLGKINDSHRSGQKNHSSLLQIKV